eukprot:CAMPEP_0185586704 /NCGR_PEP_ID=MMETSP0434-20130131/45665_1 /TAXON_ID=626734 ORGANISM="Favella taraikaensis, Strain Fe Narragansett Bay" /NCGR_SAMPLE_ID=MMETSP0434 /ASSEMBLY_ACC=CAM_ASM_000379 /LENGTH=33 /DNA_ID= /DNA_START= /DNA_END= /DNA_ORIENTATION=
MSKEESSIKHTYSANEDIVEQLENQVSVSKQDP